MKDDYKEELKLNKEIWENIVRNIKEYTINRNFRRVTNRIRFMKVKKKQVVILIDEYDKPILDNIEKKKK
jgi:hypothetical protein